MSVEVLSHCNLLHLNALDIWDDLDVEGALIPFELLELPGFVELYHLF